MVWQYNPYALPLFLTASTSVGLALVMWGRRRLFCAKAFIALLLAIAVWSFTAGLEYMSSDLYSMLLWDKASYLGIVTVPVAYAIFALQYTGHGEWSKPRLLALLFSVPIVTLLLAWTNESHHLIYSMFSVVSEYALSLPIFTWGAWAWVFLPYTYMLVLSGTALLVHHFMSPENVSGRQSAILIVCVSVCVPFVASALDVFFSTNVYIFPVDLTPFTLIFTACGFFWAVFRFHLLQIIPVAREAIVRSMRDGVIVLDASNNIVDINPAGEQMFGCKAADVLGMSAAKLFNSHRPNQQFLASSSSEITLNTSGERRSFDVHFSPLHDRSGTTVGQIGVLHDISDRKHAESEIRKLSQFLETTIDNANVWINVLDQNANVLMWNKAAEEISGYSREEVVGNKMIWEWLYPDSEYRKEVIATADEIIEKGLSEENVTTRIRRKDGQTRIISWNSKGLRDENNCTIGSVALARDVTEQVRMQKELERYSKHLEELVEERTRNLRESEERLYAIIQGSPEGILVVDPKGKIVECNRAALELFKSSSKDQLIRRNALDLVPKKDREIVSKAFTEIARSETMRNLRYTMLRSDGQEYPAEVSVSIVKDAAGSPMVYVTVVKDLTEQNEIQERLRKAERMAVIGETAAMVGHDLRNPLQGIAGAVYVLRQKFASTADPETMEMLGLIESGLDYADNIVKELMDYSGEIRLEFTETTVRAVTEAALLQVKIPENVTVRDLTQDKPRLLIDAAKTQRVFVNLIGNAIDAMPKGGELTITSSEAREILEVKFSDTGEGIPDDVMQDLWKPLKTTKSKGMGLGLVICKRIVEAHGGSIEVESTLGKGSTFTIRLPC
jgi:PAS domain S-box-containing protein